jgi:hypothetical protein
MDLDFERSLWGANKVSQKDFLVMVGRHEISEVW